MSRSFCSILEINPVENEWVPPEINIYEYAEEMRNNANAKQSDDYFYIFRTEPYIDSVYIEYDNERSQSPSVPSKKDYNIHEYLKRHK